MVEVSGERGSCMRSGERRKAYKHGAAKKVRSPVGRRKPTITRKPIETLAALVRDWERIEYLERLLKKRPRIWDLVCIETIDPKIAACNRYNGDSAGRVTAKTLREAIDLAMKK